MHKVKRLILWGIVTSLAASAVAAPPAARNGTSVLHYQVRNSLVAGETTPDVAGSLRLQQNEQGNAAKQTLQLDLEGLTPSTTYTLSAVVGDDPNPVAAATFTSDEDGDARISYSAKGQGNGKAKGALPAALNPLTNIRALSVVDGVGQTVAYTWINTSENVKYLVKRNLTATDSAVSGSISLNGNSSSVGFRLVAAGLVPDTAYSLALNGTAVATATTDASGRLEINQWPAGAPALLDLRSLQVLDGASAVVLSTTLPK